LPFAELFPTAQASVGETASTAVKPLAPICEPGIAFQYGGQIAPLASAVAPSATPRTAAMIAARARQRRDAVPSFSRGPEAFN
jgi:hypothetical protein